MELFRPAGHMEADPAGNDWTRTHGYAEKSEFTFPDLYLDDAVAALAPAEELKAFLEQCLENFVNHDYGHMSSLDLVENFLSRDVKKENTWLRGIYPSQNWGEVHLDIFYDMGLFHLDEVPSRELSMEQYRKERAAKGASL